jgi:hypothetical protein
VFRVEGQALLRVEALAKGVGVIRAGARTTRRGAAETFTGVVFQDPVITAERRRGEAEGFAIFGRRSHGRW